MGSSRERLATRLETTDKEEEEEEWEGEQAKAPFFRSALLLFFFLFAAGDFNGEELRPLSTSEVLFSDRASAAVGDNSEGFDTSPRVVIFSKLGLGAGGGGKGERLSFDFLSFRNLWAALLLDFGGGSSRSQLSSSSVESGMGNRFTKLSPTSSFFFSFGFFLEGRCSLFRTSLSRLGSVVFLF